MTEEEDVSSIGSPFTYTDQTTMTLEEKKKSPGKNALERMYSTGSIGEREMVIMEIFYEIGPLTSKLLQKAMQHPSIPNGCTKISASPSGNPYLKELGFLEERGILFTGRIKENRKERIKFFFLSSGARDWISKKAAPISGTFNDKTMPPSIPSSPLAMLNHLAAVNLHIRLLTELTGDISEKYISGNENYPFDLRYRFITETEAYALSMRSEEKDLDRAKKFLKGHPGKAKLFFILPSREMLVNVRNRLSCDFKDLDQRVEYLTDISIHNDDAMHVYVIHEGMLEIKGLA